MFSTIKPRLRGIKNALLLLIRGEWREFLIRLRISLGHIDLKDDPTETVTERTHYYADSGGLAFDKIMASFNITPHDAIVDFGCGKGGILISLSKYPFSRITGVEIAPELVEIAKTNIRKLNIKNVDIVCSDAAEFKLDNIEKSIFEQPRDVIIIYLNPNCHELIEASKIFIKTEELPHFEHKCFVYENRESN
ncbi:MAG: hypothetical protein AMK70_10005 [Nitrospira bacterium SG8_35_1]|nr:MAG: hypothetical protein AMK70_10005 [Nitrospira bacterium SG8_35_1]